MYGDADIQCKKYKTPLQLQTTTAPPARSGAVVTEKEEPARGQALRSIYQTLFPQTLLPKIANSVRSKLRFEKTMYFIIIPPVTQTIVPLI